MIILLVLEKYYDFSSLLFCFSNLENNFYKFIKYFILLNGEYLITLF